MGSNKKNPKKSWLLVFQKGKREHVVCQDYWKRFVLQANVKPFVSKNELFTTQDLFSYKGRPGVHLATNQIGKILRLSTEKSVLREKNIMVILLKRELSHLVFV